MSTGTARHPPYQLRPNKAIDRFLLVDLLRHLPIENRKRYEYIGMGGPFLEDFKIVHHYYPEMKLTSVEANPDTFKRQQFNRNCRKINTVLKEISAYFEDVDEFRHPLVVWFDGTDFKNKTIEIIHTILRKLPLNSIFKITARVSFEAEPELTQFASEATEAIRKYLESNAMLPKEKLVGMENDICSMLTRMAKQKDQTVRVMQNVADFLPEDYEQLLNDQRSRARLYFQVLQKVIESVYPRTGDTVFHLLSSHFYSDGTTMISLTGILVRRQDVPTVKRQFRCFKVQGDQLIAPTKIDIPILSVKERMKLDPFLPMRPGKSVGNRLYKKLGYLIDGSRNITESKLEFYNSYQQYYPFFSRIQL